MKKRCVELEKKNTDINHKLSQVKNEFNILVDINSSFSDENEYLKRWVREYDEDGDDFNDNLKITKKINKGKNIRNNDDESDMMDISS